MFKLFNSDHFRILTCALSLCVFSPTTLFAQTYKIGIAGPFSGPYAAFGEQMLKGAEQAAKDINAISPEFQVELIKADDSCEPKQAVSVANRLIEKDEVVSVIGHFCSSSTVPASTVYADAGIVMITPASTNPIITERGLTTVFRTCGRDDQQGSIAANFIKEQLKSQRVAIVHDNDTYGKGIADAMRIRLKQLGQEAVLYEGLTRGEKDFNAIVTKLKQVKADALYFGGLHPEAGPLIRQMREQAVDIPFISGDGIVSKDFLTTAGGAAVTKGAYMTFGSDPRKLEAGQKLVAIFKQQGYEPEGYTLYSYATLQSIVKAIQSTQSTDGKKLAAWLHNNSVNTIMGPKAWDAKGDLKVSDYVMYEWLADGTYQEVSSQKKEILKK